jgi:hypothetical protein
MCAKNYSALLTGILCIAVDDDVNGKVLNIYVDEAVISKPTVLKSSAILLNA